jgi:hypothetical protein
LENIEGGLEIIAQRDNGVCSLWFVVRRWVEGIRNLELGIRTIGGYIRQVLCDLPGGGFREVLGVYLVFFLSLFFKRKVTKRIVRLFIHVLFHNCIHDCFAVQRQFFSARSSQKKPRIKIILFAQNPTLHNFYRYYSYYFSFQNGIHECFAIAGETHSKVFSKL